MTTQEIIFPKIEPSVLLSPDIDPIMLDKFEEFLDVIGLADQIEQGLKVMNRELRLKLSTIDLDRDLQSALLVYVNQHLFPAIMKDFKTFSANRYCAEFSYEELEAVIAFNRSPLGRRLREFQFDSAEASYKNWAAMLEKIENCMQDFLKANERESEDVLDFPQQP